MAGGLLSGKYRRGEQGPEGSRHLTEWSEPPIYDEDGLYDTIDVLVEVAQGHGVSAAQVALAWLLRRPGISSLVVGARTDEQLADNLAAADLELDEAAFERLEEVAARRSRIRSGTRSRWPRIAWGRPTGLCSDRTWGAEHAPNLRNRHRACQSPRSAERTAASGTMSVSLSVVAGSKPSRS